MMKLDLSPALLAATLLGGCGLRTAEDSDPVIPDYVDTEVQEGPSTVHAVAASCDIQGADEVETLYANTEASVHELITCGGIQMQVAMSMKVMIFTSNESLVSPSARADIRDVVSISGLLVDNPFTQGDDGAWTMAAGGVEGSTFSLTFFDPQTGEQVLVDPFRLDSYLLGVTATSSRTWSEMKQDPTHRTTFTYEWTEPGPLAHLLADGGPIPNPIVLRMSLYELAGAALGFDTADYGPFESAEDLLVESNVHMVDTRDITDVTYDVTGEKTSVASLLSTGSLPFHVNAMHSTDGTYALSGDTDGLAFVGRGSMAGEIRYAVDGVGTALSVVSDFGGGMAYPSPRWECP